MYVGSGRDLIFSTTGEQLSQSIHRIVPFFLRGFKFYYLSQVIKFHTNIGVTWNLFCLFCWPTCLFLHQYQTHYILITDEAVLLFTLNHWTVFNFFKTILAICLAKFIKYLQHAIHAFWFQLGQFP